MIQSQSSPPTERIAIVTGANSNYYWLVTGALTSLSLRRGRYKFDMVVLNFGLSAEEVGSLTRNFGATVIRPEWIVDVPAALRTPANLAFGARCVLPAIVPGYDIYMWFDADGWAQNDSFLDAYINPARRGALAIVEEEEAGYPFEWKLLRWNLGNQVLGFGFAAGVRVFSSKAINNGFFAARRDSGLWRAWQRRYEEGVYRSGKIIMDQHSLRAAIALDNSNVEYLPSKNNWICSRRLPVFDTERKLFCVPKPPYEAISIAHLAGDGDKKAVRTIRCIGGGELQTPLYFHEAFELRALPEERLHRSKHKSSTF